MTRTRILVAATTVTVFIELCACSNKSPPSEAPSPAASAQPPKPEGPREFDPNSEQGKGIVAALDGFLEELRAKGPSGKRTRVAARVYAEKMMNKAKLAAAAGGTAWLCRRWRGGHVDD